MQFSDDEGNNELLRTAMQRAFNELEIYSAGRFIRSVNLYSEERSRTRGKDPLSQADLSSLDHKQVHQG